MMLKIKIQLNPLDIARTLLRDELVHSPIRKKSTVKVRTKSEKVVN